MKYIVYTDGAGSEKSNKVGISYIIMGDTTYVNSDFKQIPGMSNPTQAETIAVGLAAGYLIRNVELTKEDTVEFYIDCASTINYLNNFTGSSIDRQYKGFNEYIRLSVSRVQSLAKTVNVSFNKVKGHKAKVNPNSYVDRLAKLALRKG